MNTAEFDQANLDSSQHYDFELPKELIAQHPLPNREDSRLMVVNRNAGSIEHFHFRDIDTILKAEDCLVLNETKVIPAQLVGKRLRTGGRWQGLVLESDEQHWRMLAKTRGKIEIGEKIGLQDRQGRLRLEMVLVSRTTEGNWIGKPLNGSEHCQDEQLVGQSPQELLELIGRVPLPHYVRGGNMVDADLSDYQTVYAKHSGAIAAPTAGLHFTQPTFERLIDAGVKVAPVTLHVGIGTFRPLSAGRLSEHVMHEETGQISKTSVDRVASCREAGGRIIPVGTTSMRVIESAAAGGKLLPWEGATDLFIKPGFQFRASDGLLTNFHLPKSTLIVLVRTFGGDLLIAEAYQEAIAEKYRFFSYGDAMLIL